LGEIQTTTLLHFLIGRKQAIEEIAGNRKALLAGFLFCLSAALARHYDGKYLVREPWFLLAPAGASILTSSILFTAMYVIWSIKARRILSGSGSAYLSFLGLYWMTAPLAWLYGIPYERFLNDVDAAEANVWTLAFVSIWRVVLISRACSVLLPCSFFASFSILGTFALGLVYVAINYARMPLVSFMGGVRVPPNVEPVVTAYLIVLFFGFFALLIGGLMMLVSLFVPGREWSLKAFHHAQGGTVSRGIVLLAAGVSLVFTASLPVTQREQRLRYEVEAAYNDGHMDDALQILASHRHSEFPPQWTPPPWPEYADGARDPKFVQLVEALQRRQAVPAWITVVYRQKAALYLGNNRTIPGRDREMLQTFAGVQGVVVTPP
jgi:hypothetical protein